MSEEVLQPKTKRHAKFRLISVSRFATELLEIPADPERKFHVLFVPGNPGVVTFYTDFVIFDSYWAYRSHKQYHTVRNILFMAITEFEKLSETPDRAFMREKQDKIAFLFGIDDHWGPLQTFEEISRQVPDIALSIEREGHTHAFCCTEAGSSWVAHHVANLINNQTSRSNH